VFYEVLTGSGENGGPVYIKNGLQHLNPLSRFACCLARIPQLSVKIEKITVQELEGLLRGFLSTI